jgi:hypothetical protein
LFESVIYSAVVGAVAFGLLSLLGTWLAGGGCGEYVEGIFDGLLRFVLEPYLPKCMISYIRTGAIYFDLGLVAVALLAYVAVISVILFVWVVSIGLSTAYGILFESISRLTGSDLEVCVMDIREAESIST